MSPSERAELEAEAALVVDECLLGGAESSLVDIWLEWRRRGGPRRKQRGLPLVHRVLNRLVRDGRVEAVEADPARGTRGPRRYYRRSWRQVGT